MSPSEGKRVLDAMFGEARNLPDGAVWRRRICRNRRGCGRGGRGCRRSASEEPATAGGENNTGTYESEGTPRHESRLWVQIV